MKSMKSLAFGLVLELTNNQRNSKLEPHFIDAFMQGYKSSRNSFTDNKFIYFIFRSHIDRHETFRYKNPY